MKKNNLVMFKNNWPEKASPRMALPYNKLCYATVIDKDFDTKTMDSILSNHFKGSWQHNIQYISVDIIGMVLDVVTHANNIPNYYKVFWTNGVTSWVKARDTKVL